jgi:outer membrane protein assembly factor BamD (BamD/ComL family)
MAQISEEKHLPQEHADSLYRVLIRDYPDSPFADEARRILGLPPQEVTSDLAVVLYAEAQDLLSRDSTAAAIAMLEHIVRDYPESPIAPKAQYAIGWTYEQVAGRPDSALANFKKLVRLYPSTQYASVAFARLKDLPPEEVKRLEEGIMDEPVEQEGEQIPEVVPPEPEQVIPDSSEQEPGEGERK